MEPTVTEELHVLASKKTGEALQAQWEGMQKRIAELEAALRQLVYFDRETQRWHCGRHADADVTSVVAHVFPDKK
jgi:hypothetical protein